MTANKTVKRIQTFWMDNQHYTLQKKMTEFHEENNTPSIFICFKTSNLFQKPVESVCFQIYSHQLLLKVMGRNGQAPQIHLQPFYAAVQWLDKLSPEERFNLFIESTHGYRNRFRGYSFLFKNSNHELQVVVVVYLVTSDGMDNIIVFVDDFQHQYEWYHNVNRYLQHNGFLHGTIRCLFMNTAPFLESAEIYG